MSVHSSFRERIRPFPSDRVLKELKQTCFTKGEKRMALKRAEQDLFLDFMKNSRIYSHWYSVFAVMLGTGLRVGELTGWVAVIQEEVLWNFS